MVSTTQQLSAGWVEGESSLSSAAGKASGAVLHYYALVSAKQPCTSENSNSEPASLLQAKFPQGVKKLT